MSCLTQWAGVEDAKTSDDLSPGTFTVSWTHWSKIRQCLPAMVTMTVKGDSGCYAAVQRGPQVGASSPQSRDMDCGYLRMSSFFQRSGEQQDEKVLTLLARIQNSTRPNQQEMAQTQATGIVQSQHCFQRQRKVCPQEQPLWEQTSGGGLGLALT